jgi:MFS family permease
VTSGTAKSALSFVVVMGVVNLFADMTYEGGRGVVGAFLGHLGASGVVVGIVAGGGEWAGYAIRSLAGTVADRTGKYWIDAWAGYAINMLCVPALALAGSWPAAAGLVVGERLGRGIRRPVISAMLAQAGDELGGRGFAFGLNEALDQTGATIGPLVVAFVIARTGAFPPAFAVLIVPALLTLTFLLPASQLGAHLVPRPGTAREPAIRDRAAFARYAIGGALIAAGYVDFALIAFRFARDHVVSAAAISIWFAVAMVVAAIASPMLGRLYDRFGNAVIGVTIAIGALAAPLAFLGSGGVAEVGASLWGLGTAVQDALLLALVASVISKARGATTFGLYDLLFGTAWFAGSAVLGALLDRSTTAVAAVSLVLQLAAIPLFVIAPKPAAGSSPAD